MKTRLTKFIFVSALIAGVLGVGGVANATVTVNATSVTSDAALTITGAAASTWSLSAGALDIDSAGALSLNSSTGVINLGNDVVAQNINIGTGAAARTITIGNVTDATAVNLNTGTGGSLITTTGAGDFAVASADTVLIDSAGVLELNSSAGVISIGNDAVAQNINIGGAGVRALAIGSASATGITLVTDNSAATDVAVTGGLTVTSGATHNSFTVTSSADSETAATITANSVTTGNALSVSGTGLTTGSLATLTGTSTAIADTAAGISQVVLATTNAQGTAAQTLGGGVNALRVNFTNNPTIAGNTENVVMVQNQVTANATDNAVASLLLLDNADTDAGGSTIITDGLLITNSGAIAVGITDAIDVSASDIVNALNVGGNTITGTTYNLGASTALTLGDALTGTDGATVAIFSSDWEISTTGVMTGIGAITSDGTITSSGIFTGSGATTLDATGAAGITIGSADVTSITLTTDGGAVTVGSAGTANGDGVRIGNARVTVNKPTAAVDCGDAACTPTVTQILEAGIFFGAPTQDRAFTLPAVQGASGLVQALPGTPAVGDVFSFAVANKSAIASGFEITLAASASPTGYTLGSLGTVGGGTTTTFYCRVTDVTGDAELITCY